jgi:hypothetical protein
VFYLAGWYKDGILVTRVISRVWKSNTRFGMPQTCSPPVVRLGLYSQRPLLEKRDIEKDAHDFAFLM